MWVGVRGQGWGTDADNNLTQMAETVEHRVGGEVQNKRSDQRQERDLDLQSPVVCNILFDTSLPTFTEPGWVSAA